MKWLAILGVMALVGCAASSETTGGAADEVNAEAPITPANFVAHPRIVEVRNDVKAIEDQITAGALTKSEKLELCDGIGEADRVKFADASGKVRKLVLTAGSDHSFVTETYYYGANGKLRFMFHEISSIFGEQGTSVELAREGRMYLNGAGERFFIVERAVQSEPGKPMPAIDTGKFVVAEDAPTVEPIVETSPAQAFDRPAQCN